MNEIQPDSGSAEKASSSNDFCEAMLHISFELWPTKAKEKEKIKDFPYVIVFVEKTSQKTRILSFIRL